MEPLAPGSEQIQPNSAVFLGSFAAQSRALLSRKDGGSLPENGVLVHSIQLENQKPLMVLFPSPRVAEKYEENKMSPNNLGIVFGPTLLRPGSGSDGSMSCLVDSGYQAQIVEFLIQNYERVFGMDDLPSSLSLGCENPSQEASMAKDEGPHCPDMAQNASLEVELPDTELGLLTLL